MAKKQKAPNSVQAVTPQGTLMHVTITGEGKPNLSNKMTYSASIILNKTDPAVQALLQKIQELYDNNHDGSNEFGSFPYRPCLADGTYKVKKDENDKGTLVKEDETDYILLGAKTYTTFGDGNPKVIHTYNEKAQKIQLGDQLIGNTSKGALSGTLKYYENAGKDGITYYLNAIQITDLVEYQQDAGFEQQEKEVTELEAQSEL